MERTKRTPMKVVCPKCSAETDGRDRVYVIKSYPSSHVCEKCYVDEENRQAALDKTLKDATKRGLVENRIIVRWNCGAFVTSSSPMFQEDLDGLVAQYGEPSSVKFRSTY